MLMQIERPQQDFAVCLLFYTSHEKLAHYVLRRATKFQSCRGDICFVIGEKPFANKKNNYHAQDVEIWRRNVECHDLTFGMQRVMLRVTRRRIRASV